MTIKQLGGVFGRNPTFNDVTIEGQLTFEGDIDVNSDLKVSGDLDVTGGMTVDGSTLVVDNSNNRVGVGTDTPDTVLEVVGSSPILTVRDTQTGSATANATLRLAESGASSSLDQYFDIKATNGKLEFIDQWNEGGGTGTRLTLTDAGSLQINTAGQGIDFSATSDAPGATSEILNDYEEGTWTPVLTVNGFSGGPTLSSSVATYTKVGRVVHATCRLVMSAATYPSSYCQITGTPFVSDVGSNFVGVYDGSNPGAGTQGGVLTMGAAGIFTTPMGTTNTSTAWNFTVTYAVA